MTVEAEQPLSHERDWWRRALLVLRSPRQVFAAFRDGEGDEARQEPLLAIVWLAGIGAILMTNQWGRNLDDYELDLTSLAVITFLGGGFYGIAGYFVVGGLTRVGERLAGGGDGSFRRARHLATYAAMPLVVSLLAWPFRLAVFGADSFRSGGGDAGAAGAVFEAVELGAIAWALALLVVALAVVNRWDAVRAVAAATPLLVAVAYAYARGFGIA